MVEFNKTIEIPRSDKLQLDVNYKYYKYLSLLIHPRDSDPFYNHSRVNEVSYEEYIIWRQPPVLETNLGNGLLGECVRSDLSANVSLQTDECTILISLPRYGLDRQFFDVFHGNISYISEYNFIVPRYLLYIKIFGFPMIFSFAHSVFCPTQNNILYSFVTSTEERVICIIASKTDGYMQISWNSTFAYAGPDISEGDSSVYLGKVPTTDYFSPITYTEEYPVIYGTPYLYGIAVLDKVFGFGGNDESELKTQAAFPNSFIAFPDFFSSSYSIFTPDRYPPINTLPAYLNSESEIQGKIFYSFPPTTLFSDTEKYVKGSLRSRIAVQPSIAFSNYKIFSANVRRPGVGGTLFSNYNLLNYLVNIINNLRGTATSQSLALGSIKPEVNLKFDLANESSSSGIHSSLVKVTQANLFNLYELHSLLPLSYLIFGNLFSESETSSTSNINLNILLNDALLESDQQLYPKLNVLISPSGLLHNLSDIINAQAGTNIAIFGKLITESQLEFFQNLINILALTLQTFSDIKYNDTLKSSSVAAGDLFSDSNLNSFKFNLIKDLILNLKSEQTILGLLVPNILLTGKLFSEYFLEFYLKEFSKNIDLQLFNENIIRNASTHTSIEGIINAESSTTLEGLLKLLISTEGNLFSESTFIESPYIYKSLTDIISLIYSLSELSANTIYTDIGGEIPTIDDRKDKKIIKIYPFYKG